MTGVVVVTNGCRGGGCGKRAMTTTTTTTVKREAERESQLSVIALLMATIRKSMVHCRMSLGEEEDGMTKMDIGWPTEVRHVAHVTFDRFNGFLGLPVEFEVEIPCPAPSASVSVFGVSAESMQCGFDSNGNSVPTILLLMQERLYAQAGLKAEGIFRINPENSQEKDLRNQLNKGIVPDDIDVHCLAALIKAWFRELPEGVLDKLSPGQVLQCETEEDCIDLVNLLPPTQFALLSWAVDLMADVVEEEEINKMNARNIAMVFAPNMTQVSDPLTSLIHAVQVMNLLQTLIFRTLREREDAAAMEGYSLFSSSLSSEGDKDSESDELRGNNSPADYETNVHCELEEDASYDLGLIFSSSRGSDVADEIEERFLKQLELNLKGENGNNENCESKFGPILQISEDDRGSSSSITNRVEKFEDINFQSVESGLKSSEIELGRGSSSSISNEVKESVAIDLQSISCGVKSSDKIDESSKEVKMVLEALKMICQEY